MTQRKLAALGFTLAGLVATLTFCAPGEEPDPGPVVALEPIPPRPRPPAPPEPEAQDTADTGDTGDTGEASTDEPVELEDSEATEPPVVQPIVPIDPPHPRLAPPPEPVPEADPPQEAGEVESAPEPMPPDPVERPNTKEAAQAAMAECWDADCPAEQYGVLTASLACHDHVESLYRGLQVALDAGHVPEAANAVRKLGALDARDRACLTPTMLRTVSGWALTECPPAEGAPWQAEIASACAALSLAPGAS